MRSGSFITLSLALASVACEPKAERDPPLPCPGCGNPNTGITGGSLPPPDVDGGTAGSGSSEPVRLEGEVRILNDLAGVTATLFAEAAALRVEGTNGDVVGQWNGIDSFAIDGVKSAAAVWAQVTPGPGDALIGLGPVDTSSPDDSGVVTTVLAVARASDFREAFDLLSSPIALDEAAAQAILIAQTNNAAVAGVRVVAPLDRTVLYVENGAFTDTATSTDASGRFMLANVPAGDWPGNTVTLTLDGPVSGRYDLKVVSGGMTLGKVGN